MNVPLTENAGWGWLLGNVFTTGNLLWWGLKNTRGGASQSNPVNADLALAMQWEGSAQARWCLPVDCTRRWLDKGKVAAIPPALTLMLHNSVFPGMFLVPPKLLTICQTPG